MPVPKTYLTMKFPIPLISLLLVMQSYANSGCDEAYQSASYALSHIKTSMEWNNLESQRQYAKRAIEAMDKVKVATKSCGCKEAYNNSYDALDKLYKSLEQDTFETSRYQISKANIDAREVLVSLDQCRNDPAMALQTDAENLALREQQLLEEKQQLQEDQKRLQRLMEEQQRKQQLLAEELQQKFTAQKILKTNAEAGLQQLEDLVVSLIETMDCPRKFPMAKNYVREIESLQDEPLSSTRAFYSSKIKEMAYALINNLSACEEQD